MSVKYFNIEEVGKRLGVTERWIQRKCKDGTIPGAKKVDGSWMIPSTYHVSLWGGPDPGNIPDEFYRLPKSKQDRAIERVSHIKAAEKRAAQYVRDGLSHKSGISEYARENRISTATVYRWIKQYRQGGVLAIVDTRGGGSCLGEMISPEAWGTFKAMYLTQQQLSVKLCWENIVFINKDQSKGWKVPSLPYMYVYVKKHIPYPALVLHREGLAAYEAKCAPYIRV